MEESVLTGWYGYLAKIQPNMKLLLWAGSLVIFSIVIISVALVLESDFRFLSFLILAIWWVVVHIPITKISSFRDDDKYYRWGYVVEDNKITRYGKSLYSHKGESVHKISLSRHPAEVDFRVEIKYNNEKTGVVCHFSVKFTSFNAWTIESVLNYIEEKKLFSDDIASSTIAEKLFREAVEDIDSSEFIQDKRFIPDLLLVNHKAYTERINKACKKKFNQHKLYLIGMEVNVRGLIW
ncbi:MAG: hypothetical protein NUV82_03120 [Candidatus Komeilibacteria bacterium]|nr:hypothetical protein [Candidatus Komeilibacteria bacterium]